MQRRYEDTIVYTPGDNTRDGKSGNAVLSATVKGIPLGNYQIYEKQILLLFERQKKNTSNVNIINAGSTSIWNQTSGYRLWGSKT